ncbi:MAG: hypothetical protein JWL76_736 [Thermoleophilia bacterium]|nr:hypothetical protein [Thermoleophilia bacterium]
MRYRISGLCALVVALVFVACVPTAASAATLYGTVGPGYTISLTTTSGVAVRSIAAGRQFDIVVRDRSSHHNFRLAGPGLTRQTSVAFVGTTRPWRVTFTRGTWTYLCQPHSLTMKATIVVR